MSISKSRNVTIFKSASSKIYKIIQPASLKTIDNANKCTDIKAQGKDKLTNKLQDLKLEITNLRAILKESELLMQTSTTKSHKDANSLKQILQEIWPSIESQITESQKSKIKDMLQKKEESISKQKHVSEEVQCGIIEEISSVSVREKFQTELTKCKQNAEDTIATVQQVEEQIIQCEKNIAELSHELSSYKKFSECGDTIGVATFMHLLN